MIATRGYEAVYRLRLLYSNRPISRFLEKIFNRGLRGFHGSMHRLIRVIRAIRGQLLFGCGCAALGFLWLSPARLLGLGTIRGSLESD